MYIIPTLAELVETPSLCFPLSYRLRFTQHRAQHQGRHGPLLGCGRRRELALHNNCFGLRNVSMVEYSAIAGFSIVLIGCYPGRSDALPFATGSSRGGRVLPLRIITILIDFVILAPDMRLTVSVPTSRSQRNMDFSEEGKASIALITLKIKPKQRGLLYPGETTVNLSSFSFRPQISYIIQHLPLKEAILFLL